EQSLLVEAINYGETRQMPPKSKLPDPEIAILTQWVKMGAPWGAGVPASTSNQSSKSSSLAANDFEAQFHQRARDWRFQPIRRASPAAAPPALSRWVRNPIDAFILGPLTSLGLAPAAEAPRHILIRRLSYDLIGLPPTPEEVREFIRD